MSDCSPSPRPKTKEAPSASGEEPADIVKLFKSFRVEEEERVTNKSRTGSEEAENAASGNLRQDSEENGSPEENRSDSSQPPPDPGRYPTAEQSPQQPSDDVAKSAESTKASPNRTRNRESSSQNFSQILAALSTLPSLPSVGDINALPASHLTMVDDVMARVICDWRPSPENLEFRRQMFGRLESFVCRMFHACRLHAFGSSVNGFEFAEADLDCTLALPFNVNERQHVAWIAAYLAKAPSFFYDVTAVTGCRVPIVRLKMRSGSPNVEDLAVDISIGNMLGIRNSAMLRRYSMIDRRVKPLGYTVKLFAKMTKAGDARMGGLSSYAYLLLVIYYLQRCSPPVVPVLQELLDPLKPPNRSLWKCDRWDTYFFDGSDDDLARLWPLLGGNTDSPGQLFLGFLRYYLEEFDYENQLVCIRNLEPLTRKKKGWSRHFLAIEDPFDLHHNLGAVADKDKLIYILRSWHKAFQVFSTPLSLTPSSSKSSSTSSSSSSSSSSPPSSDESLLFKIPSHYGGYVQNPTPAHFLLDPLRYLECDKCGLLGCDFDNEFDYNSEWPTLNGPKKRRKCRGRAESGDAADLEERSELDTEETKDSNGNAMSVAIGGEEKKCSDVKVSAGRISELKKNGISGF